MIIGTLTQKQLIAEQVVNMGGKTDIIADFMKASTNFYFDSVNLTLMDTWSKEWVVLVGNTGYSVSLL